MARAMPAIISFRLTYQNKDQGAAAMSNHRLQSVMEFVRSDANVKRLNHDLRLYTIYNGKLKDIIIESLMDSYKKKTVELMKHEVVAINLIQRITEKLSQLYKDAANREPVDENPSDIELIEQYEKSMNIDVFMKQANRLFKLTKHCMLEPFIDCDQKMAIRVLPSHNFTLFSNDPLCPERPTLIVKHLFIDNSNPANSRHAIWTDEKHFIVDGDGKIDLDAMNQLKNPEFINPFGKIPMVHVSDSLDQLTPIQEDDLLCTQLLVSRKLTDLCFGQKYLTFGALVVTGVAKDFDFDYNPNAINYLPNSPDGTVSTATFLKPHIDTEATLKTIEQIVAMLLTSKNLSVGDIEGTMNGASPEAGIAKLIDRSSVNEDRQDQIAFFDKAEKDLWHLIAFSLLPVWVDTKQIDPELAGAFSKDFELSIEYPEIRPVITEREKVEVIGLKVDKGFMTKFDAIKELNPRLDDEQIQRILDDVQKEGVENFNFFQKNAAQGDDENGSKEPNFQSKQDPDKDSK